VAVVNVIGPAVALKVMSPLVALGTLKVELDTVELDTVIPFVPVAVNVMCPVVTVRLEFVVTDNPPPDAVNSMFRPAWTGVVV
jgi:hypothetical protein